MEPRGEKPFEKYELPPRFRSKFSIDKETGCWIWRGVRNKSGYGYLCCESDTHEAGKTMRGAHRVVYELYYGKIPDGLFVRHICDNPSCVNPKHLLVGTAKENTQDSIRRGTFVRGERHWNFGGTWAGPKWWLEKDD